MMNIEHALALLLLLGFPVWDVVETRALKAGTNPRRQIGCYQRTTAVLWVSAIVAWTALRSTVFFVWPDVRESLWQKKIHGSFVWGLVIAWLAVNLVRSFQRRGTRLRDTTVAALRRLDFFLPATREERMWFAVVSVTAGICEEVLYRGFLIRYFADAPWHMGLTIALIISGVCFGFAHTYQGVGGIISTGFFGALMAVVFFITRSLWLPMAMHAFLDLNVLLLLRRGDLPAETGAEAGAQ